MLKQGVGHQLVNDELHQRQQGLRAEIVGPIVVAVGISAPVNIGSIFRICDALNCKNLIFVDTPNFGSKKIKRVSRSMNEKMLHQFIAFEEFREIASSLGTLVAIEITSYSANLFVTKVPSDAVFVVGNERHGISDEVLSLCSYVVHVPMFGINSSMNVATSLAVVLYEWYRRRCVTETTGSHPPA